MNLDRHTLARHYAHGGVSSSFVKAIDAISEGVSGAEAEIPLIESSAKPAK